MHEKQQPAADDATADVAWAYRAFARLEAHGRSPSYEELAVAVAEDAGIVGFLAALPAAKRQPNLLFAAAGTCSAGRPQSVRCETSSATRRPS